MVENKRVVTVVCNVQDMYGLCSDVDRFYLVSKDFQEEIFYLLAVEISENWLLHLVVNWPDWTGASPL